MNQRNFLLCCCIIFTILFFYSCSNEPDNTATSDDGVNIVFDKQGEGNPAIIFVHGWANNRSIWDEQIKHFSKKYAAVAVDLPGFGESGNNRSNWTIKSFGDDVAAVINKLNLSQAVLVGFSMGAPVVIEAANKIPEVVIGVVLVDDMHNIEMKIPPQMVSYIDSVFMDLVENPTNEKLIAGGFYKKNPEESYQKVLSMIKDTSRIGWRESLHSTFQWHNEHCIESLKQLNAPLAAINTDMQPTNAEAFSKYVPSFQLKVIQGAGHVVMWDATEEFNRLLEESIQEFKKPTSYTVN
jgi:pimeloyl-ACP methyl ester carboxylesterase